MKIDRKFVVYMAVNIINGNRYIGYTCNFASRRIAHLGRARRRDEGCPKFHNALRKYGEDAFTWQILATLNTREAAVAQEIRLIKRLKPEYNLSAGGEGPHGIVPWNRKPVICLEDGRRFPSVRHAADFYGLRNVAVWDACMMTRSRSASGIHFIFGVKKYGERYRKRLIRNIERGCAERRKRRKQPNLTMPYRGVIRGMDCLGRSAAGPMKNAKQVICLDDGRKFPSANAAARHYNVCQASLSAMCAGAVIRMKNGNTTKRKSVGGMRFKYTGTGVLH
jgi:predicted GIY-YIG superfamily endonuclease